MSNKKDIKQQVRSDVTMLEELKQLKQDLSAYKQNGEEMGKELLSMKRQNAGLKGQNTLLRNQIKELQKRVEHYKALDLEGDELNEKRIAENESLMNEIREVNKQLKTAEDQCAIEKTSAMRKHKEIEKLKDKLSDQLNENSKLRSIIREYEEMPWYKRLFY